jgi:hypothetical protein
MKRCGEWRYNSTILSLSTICNRVLHAPDALPLRETDPGILFVGDGSSRIADMEKIRSLAHAGNRTPIPRTSSSQPTHCTD